MSYFDMEDMYEMCVICEHSTFSMVWGYLELIACILSSYLYAYLAATYWEEVAYEIKKLELFFDVFFGLDILKKFFTDYTPIGETVPKKDVSIIRRYLRSSFRMDFLLFFPFFSVIYSISDRNEDAKILFLIKTYRIIRGGFKIFNVSKLHQQVIRIIMKRNELLAKENPMV
jgi:hypothetical protein